MTERIGLEAILNDRNFQAGLARYVAGLGTMNTQTSSTATNLSSRFNALQGVVVSAATAMGTALVAGAAAAGVAVTGMAVKGTQAAAGMEEQISAIASVMNRTADEVAPLRDLIVDLGIDPRLKVTAVEAGQAIEMLARNGLSMTQILDGAAFNTVLLANAVGTDLSNAANIATDAMAIFDIGAADMGEAVDGIVSVTTTSKFTIDDYALALRNGGAAAADMRVPMEEFNAVIAASAEELGSGMRAGTGFRNFITRLTPKTIPATESMRELGLITEDGANAFFDATGKLKSMSEVSRLLTNSLGSLTDEQRSATIENIFGADAMGTVLALMREGQPAFESAAEAMATLGVSQEEANRLFEEGATNFDVLMMRMAETDAVKNAETRMNNLKGAMEIFSGVVETIMIRLGEHFIPIVTQVTRSLTDLVANNADRVVNFFQTVADVLGAFLSGAPGDFPWEDIFPPGLADFMYDLSASFEFLRDALGYLFDGNWEAALTNVGMAFGMMEDDANDAAVTLIDTFNTAMQFIVDHGDTILNVMLGIAAAMKSFSIITGVVNLFTKLSTAVGAVSAVFTAAGGGIGGIVAVLGGPVLLAIAAIAAAIGFLVFAWRENLGGIRDIVTEWWENTLKPNLQMVYDFLAIVIPYALEQLRMWWVDVAWPAIQLAMETVWPIIQTILQSVWDWLSVNVPLALETLRAIWVDVVWPALQTAVETVWPIIQGIFTALVDFFTVTLPTALTAVRDWFVGVWTTIQTTIQTVWGIIQPIYQWFHDVVFEILIPAFVTVRDSFVEAWTAMQTLQTAVWFVIMSIWTELGRWINENIMPWVDAMKLAWETAWTAIETVVNTVWGSLQIIFQEIGDWLTTTITEALNALHTLWVETVWPAIETAITKVWGVIQPIFDTISNILGVLWKGYLETIETVWNTVFENIRKAVEDKTKPVLDFFDAVKSFADWLSTALFEFDFEIPDLPDWMIPGSPIPLHTAWKNFSEFVATDMAGSFNVLDSAASRLSGSMGVAALQTAAIPAPVVNVDGGSTNSFTVNMSQTESEMGVRNAIRMMERLSGVTSG